MAITPIAARVTITKSSMGLSELGSPVSFEPCAHAIGCALISCRISSYRQFVIARRHDSKSGMRRL